MFAGLSRGIDIRLASNRIALAMWIVAVAAYIGLAATGDRYTYTAAVAGSIAVFLGWACGRELDPDRPHVATVAVFGAFLAGFVALPSALIVGSALVALRITVGTVGRWLTPSDLLFVAIVGFGSGGHLWAWPIAIVGAVALRFAPEVGSLRWAAIAIVAASFVVAWYLGDLNPINLTNQSLGLVAGSIVATLLATARVSVTGRADRRSVVLNENRIVFGRLAAGVIVAWAAFIGGTDAFWAVAPVGAALLAATLSSVWLFFPKSKSSEIVS